jgi:type IV fimbrial biogenesis protein FimT
MGPDQRQLLDPAQGRCLLMTIFRASGFTLIELIVTIAVMSILLFVALPNFSIWLQNTQIRTAGEAILNGLQLARAEAVRRNTNVALEMGVGSGWTVTVVSTDEVIQTRPAGEGSAAAVVTIAPAGSTKATFNGFGSITGTAQITEIKIDSPALAAADSRKLCVMVGSSGAVRLCDPKVGAGDPRACTPAVPAGCL